jgi:hypothetical protein
VRLGIDIRRHEMNLNEVFAAFEREAHPAAHGDPHSVNLAAW